MPSNPVPRSGWSEEMSINSAVEHLEIIRAEADREVRVTHTSERFELLLQRLKALEVTLGVLAKKEPSP